MSIEKLLVPFSHDHLEFKVEVKSKDGQKGQASTFVDPRRYQERLDEVFGLNWSVEYRPIGEQGVIARLTVISDGVTVVREEVGEFSGGGKSQFPTATAQAFKRACASLGLGRYLYFLPKMWGMIDQYNQFTPEEIKRFKGMCPAPDTRPAKPAPAASNGADALKHAQAVKRIGELLTECQKFQIDVDLPNNWQKLPFNQLVTLGQSIAKIVSEADEADVPDSK